MVDTYCLGVKNAFPSRLSLSDYDERLLADLRRRYGLEAMAPACARKLIEGAVGYAMRLGFAPHHDYKQACWVFGGINAADCPREFVYGRDGKPFYIRGPNETEEQARRIVEHLHRRCGAGGYDYLVALGEADDISGALSQTS